ncbi:DNA methylase N-4/N-6 [Phaeovibrio sulfidiphilus]|uniref:DNA methylase N-4/N-6 n=1 Tax=Phaeovibrio sulfidiphilus TaxID=1220600 RepID=A0A8J6YP53_9PROT|nr:DNA methylase N-4/N-6 [Phaeovibrio sulfidiphilus]MBE1237404.1 DNA methylase N-4/N-6 [Phaeovibrio sulfidiphilus]
MEMLREKLEADVGTLTGRLCSSHTLLAKNWFARHEFLGPSSTNQDTHNLPFQRWYRFKEAFSPRAVVDAISKLEIPPTTCIDPFGGSGTTALTAQFLGIRPTTVEVNPFLADLIEAKLASYEIEPLLVSFRQVVDHATANKTDPARELSEGPKTLVAPGVGGRWIYSLEVAERILAYRKAIEALDNPAHARLLRVLLGSALIPLSNVIISGKGRRYRSGWQSRTVRSTAVHQMFEVAFLNAIEDIVRFGRRPCPEYTLLRGDSRIALTQAPPADFSLFSPPYPNSFDYTDVYNIELWMLGYLKTPEDNRKLREATLRSHVQIKRSFEASSSSPTLDLTMLALDSRRSNMWNRSIPEMIRAYFDDLVAILAELHRIIVPGGSVMMVVGDSQYAGVVVDVGTILVELGRELGFELFNLSAMRSMRSSAQQGGAYDLGETLIHMVRN